MLIQYSETPKPHIMVEDWFNQKELTDIWSELDFLTTNNKLRPPEKTNPARVNGQIIKQNHGIPLDDVYSDRGISNILTFNRKLWDKEFVDNISQFNYLFKYLFLTNQDTTLVSYYEDGDHYKDHFDVAFFTAVIHLYKEPLAFTGGDFMLEDKVIPIKNNRLILFPSIVHHAVTTTKFIEPQKKFCGLGRYTISQFIGIRL